MITHYNYCIANAEDLKLCRRPTWIIDQDMNTTPYCHSISNYIELMLSCYLPLLKGNYEHERWSTKYRKSRNSGGILILIIRVWRHDVQSKCLHILHQYCESQSWFLDRACYWIVCMTTVDSPSFYFHELTMSHFNNITPSFLNI